MREWLSWHPEFVFAGAMALFYVIFVIVGRVHNDRVWRAGGPERARKMEQKKLDDEYEQWKLKHGLGPDKGGVGDV